MSDQQKHYLERKKECYTEAVGAFKRERAELQQAEKRAVDLEKSIFDSDSGGRPASAQSEALSEASSIGSRAEKHAGTAYGDMRMEFWADAEDEVQKEMKSKARRKMSMLRRKMKADAAAEQEQERANEAGKTVPSLRRASRRVSSALGPWS
jgi:hypothetical protein